jgi:hypothetical protein
MPKPFKVRIPLDKESSVEETQAATKEIQVYTDRSITDKRVRATAILTRLGNDH